MITAVKGSLPGVVGNGTSASMFTIAYLTSDIIPVLHAISLVAGTTAAIATAVYYIHKMRK